MYDDTEAYLDFVYSPSLIEVTRLLRFSPRAGEVQEAVFIRVSILTEHLHDGDQAGGRESHGAEVS